MGTPDDRFEITLRKRSDLPMKEWSTNILKRTKGGKVEYVSEHYHWWQAVVVDRVTGETKDAWGLSEQEASCCANGLRMNWQNKIDGKNGGHDGRDG